MAKDFWGHTKNNFFCGKAMLIPSTALRAGREILSYNCDSQITYIAKKIWRFLKYFFIPCGKRTYQLSAKKLCFVSAENTQNFTSYIEGQGFLIG
jgi:hypothetical protein